MKFATAFSPPADVRLECPEASLTQQEFADETDLNKIMEKYAAGLGALPVRNDTPFFGDFSSIPDYAQSLEIVSKANEAFGNLPAALRARFDNDPQKLLSFLNDKSNKEEAIKLGLIPQPDEPVSTAPAPAQEAHKPVESTPGAAESGTSQQK